MEIEYKVKRQTEKIGSLELEIECLENLDHTIDQVFEYLEKSGTPQKLEELCPYFGVVWPAARGLSEYLASLPMETFKDQRVLELGCGLAVPGMVVAKLGGQVVATDFHPEVPRFLEKNILLNSIQGLEYRAVNWEKDHAQLGKFSWVIGSDILYERGYPDTLAEALSLLTHPGGKIVIADPGRPYLQNFVDAMKRKNFQHQLFTKKVTGPSGPQEVFVFIFEAPLS